MDAYIEDLPNVDVVVFRQNTEGLYAGVEWSNPPQPVRDALKTHSKFKPFENVQSAAGSQIKPYAGSLAGNGCCQRRCHRSSPASGSASALRGW